MKKSVNDRYRQLVESAPQGIEEIDASGTILFSNTAHHRMLGYDEGELIGTSALNLVPEAERKNLKTLFARLAGEQPPPAPFYAENLRKDGSTIHVRVDWDYKRDKSGGVTGFIAIVTDVSDMKSEHQAQLRLSEGKYRALSREFSALLDAIPDSIILLDRDLKIIWANRAFADLHRRAVSSLSGETCYQACYRNAAPCGNCAVLKCFTSGREESTRVMSSDGKIYDKRAFPVRTGSSGNIIHVLEVARNVTAQVHMEEKARMMQSRMIQANKMTSLGMLVSEVAHEINNPNTYIMNNSQTALAIWKDAVEVLSRAYRRQKDMSLAGIPFLEARKLMPQLLLGIYDGSLRIRNIVDNLKNFSRPDKSSLEGELNISRVLMAATSILERHIRSSTSRYHIQIEEGIPVLRGSEQQIEQVVINLVLNALQSLPHTDAGVDVSARFIKKKNVVEIRVKDEGRGITHDILSRVTEPFFTTKLDSGGTGLGLSISQSIIRDHGGSLAITSRKGKGTTVTVELPVRA